MEKMIFVYSTRQIQALLDRTLLQLFVIQLITKGIFTPPSRFFDELSIKILYVKQLRNFCILANFSRHKFTVSFPFSQKNNIFARKRLLHYGLQQVDIGMYCIRFQSGGRTQEVKKLAQKCECLRKWNRWRCRPKMSPKMSLKPQQKTVYR